MLNSATATRPKLERDAERIPVAAQRPTDKPHQPPPRHPVGDASGAGITILMVIGLLTALGIICGQRLGVATSGGIVGCFLGAIASFAATYLRYRDL